MATCVRGKGFAESKAGERGRPKGPGRGAVKATTAIVEKPKARRRVTRKQLEDACRTLGLVPFAVARKEIGELQGFGRPVSRQTIYKYFEKRELVQGVSVAGKATVTLASLDALKARRKAGS